MLKLIEKNYQEIIIMQNVLITFTDMLKIKNPKRHTYL